MKFSVFQASHQGGRAKNEDRKGHCYTRDAALFVLADGLGGHPAGDLAAATALRAAADAFAHMALPAVADPARFLNHALWAGHLRIERYAAENHLSDPPLTTLVAALIQDGQLHWIHCGDSRLYVVRDGQLLLRTRDHSFAEHSARGGLLNLSPHRGMLYSCLGSRKSPMADLGGPLALQQGDRLLLCSDGLWDNLGDEAIVAGLASGRIGECTTALIEQALQQGGRWCDNVTVVAVHWGDGGEGSGAHAIDTVTLANLGVAMPVCHLPNVPAEGSAGPGLDLIL